VDMTIRLRPGAVDSLRDERWMADAMMDVAETVAQSVRDEAPVDTGDYRDSIGTGSTSSDRDGVYATVTTSDPAWHIIEYGTADTPAYAPMRAGAEAAGLRFRDTGEE